MTTNTTTNTFTPLCGIPNAFDPNEKSECCTVCKPDNPEAFAECSEFFKTNPPTKTKSVSARGPARGLSFWGHIKGTQAGLIDDALIYATEPLTLEKIAEMAGAKIPRTLDHLKWVQSDRMAMFCKGGNVLFTKDKKIVFTGNEKAFSVVGNLPSTDLMTVDHFNLRKPVVKKPAAVAAKPDAVAAKPTKKGKK